MSRSWTSRNTRLALNFAARRHGWYAGANLEFEPGVVYRSYGRAVTMARPRRRYAISVDGRSSGVLHEPRVVFVAWHAGRPAGMLVVMWCGGRLVTAELTDDATRGQRLCLMCPARRDTLALVSR